MRALGTLLGCILLAAAAPAVAFPDGVFADGFEPPCFGIANDLPGCIVVPFNQAPLTPSFGASTNAAWNRVDLYVLVDRSGSMSTEITSIKNNVSTVVANLTCKPLGAGTPPSCIDDLWAGAGTFAYSLSGADAYRHFADLQPFPSFAALPTTEPAGCCFEDTWFALYSTITGQGGTSCPPLTTAARTDCTPSPAGATGTGYGCFRPDAASVVLLASDEQPSLNFTCPDWTTVVKPQYLARGARVVVAYGDGLTQAAIDEFKGLATDTGAVDALNQDAPLAFSGAGANSATAIQNGLLAFRAGLKMSVRPEVVDDAGDSFDVAAFVDRLEVVNNGSNGCPNGANTDDFDGDLVDDTFVGVLPGTKVCFRLIPKQNQTAPATGTIQIFPATLRFIGDKQMTIAEIPLKFAVPSG